MNNSRNIENTWSGIKELITHRGSSHPSKLILNNKIVKDPKAITTALNDYFAAIGSKLSSTIPTINVEPESFLGPALTNSFFVFL